MLLQLFDQLFDVPAHMLLIGASSGKLRHCGLVGSVRQEVFPHASARRVEPEVDAGIEIEEHGLVVQGLANDIARDDEAARRHVFLRGIGHGRGFSRIQ